MERIIGSTYCISGCKFNKNEQGSHSKAKFAEIFTPYSDTSFEIEANKVLDGAFL